MGELYIAICYFWSSKTIKIRLTVPVDYASVFSTLSKDREDSQKLTVYNAHTLRKLAELFLMTFRVLCCLITFTRFN